MNTLLRFTSWLIDLYNRPVKVVPEPIVQTPPLVPPTPPVITPRERIYNLAKASLGKDISPRDIASDEFGCVESYDEIHKLARGFYINGTKNKVIVSTIEAYSFMRNSPYFKEVTIPQAGDTILCVTGTGNGAFYNGHIGVCGHYGIMSNSSSSGRWEQNYSYQEWESRFGKVGGFKIHYFRSI